MLQRYVSYFILQNDWTEKVDQSVIDKVACQSKSQIFMLKASFSHIDYFFRFTRIVFRKVCVYLQLHSVKSVRLIAHLSLSNHHLGKENEQNPKTQRSRTIAQTSP